MQNRSQPQEPILQAIQAAGHTPETIGAHVGIDADSIRAGNLEVGDVSTIATALERHYLDLLIGVPA